MIKNVIAPVQAWLLSQSRCVGCGNDLKQYPQENFKSGKKVTCLKCGRIFIIDTTTQKYRRALVVEI